MQQAWSQAAPRWVAGTAHDVSCQVVSLRWRSKEPSTRTRLPLPPLSDLGQQQPSVDEQTALCSGAMLWSRTSIARTPLTGVPVRVAAQEARVNWAFQKDQREDTSSHFHIFVGDLAAVAPCS